MSEAQAAPEQPSAVAEALSGTPAPETPAAPQSDREAFNAVWDKHADTMAAEDPPPDDSPTEQAAPEGDDDRPRDERGRFVSKDGEGEETGQEAGQDSDDGASPVPDGAEGGEAEAADGSPPLDPRAARLPAALKEAWGDIPDAAKEAIIARETEFGRKSGEHGEQLAKYKTVADRIVEAADQYPDFRGMTPQQIADGAVSLAKVQADMARDPAGTILNVARQYGVAEQLRASLEGVEMEPEAAAVEELQREIAGLKQQLAATGDEAAFEARVARAIEMRDNQRAVEEFRSRPHWRVLENNLPPFIEQVREESPDLSGPAILEKAYTLALTEFGLSAGATDTTPEPAKPAAAPKPDPKRAEAAKRAASVNRRGRESGTPRAQTDRELMGSVLDKHGLLG